MACPLLDKLPPELRTKIYEYVLYFDDVPLRHVKQLQPFIKKLTGGDGELPFSYEDRGKRGPELDWIMCDDELLGSRQTETGILSTCKTVHTEAIKVFYDQNIISVELFKLGDVTTPAGSDLSLTKRLMARFNGSCSVLDQCSQIFNTIDLDNLVIRSEAMFPSLQSMVVHTDGTTKPSTSLFEIFLDCDNSPAIITDAKFCNVGCFTTLTRSGFALTVKFRELAELWQEISELSFSSRMRAVHGFGIRDDSLASWTHQAFLDRLIFEKSGDDSTSEDMRTFREGLALKYYPHSKTLGLDDNAYWTHVASPYEPYDYDSWFWALNN